MIIDNTAGLQYLLNEDIYLLKQDMDNLSGIVAESVSIIEAPIATIVKPEAIVEQAIIMAEAPAPYFNHVGGNAKQFLIICNYPADQMDEKHLQALQSALSRKELALDDVAIINLSKHEGATITQLNEYFKPTRLLLLGSACLVTGWDALKLNQLANLDGMKALYTYSFTEMMGDREKTKAFWEQMKVL